jgi:hypothetical protein
MRRYFVGLFVVVCSLSSGCWQFRGIPAHGGGKRFDEEQRVVVGSIRRTISSMKLDELKGKRTKIVVASLHTSGGGTVSWGGLQSITASASLLDREEYWLRRLAPTAPDNTVWRHQYDDTKNIQQDTDTVNVQYRPRHTYRAATQSTERDVQYFRASLDMKARHIGIPLVGQKQEATLFVLVDVLGTNRSRRDLFVYSSDELLCSCEVTYYAVDNKTGKLLFTARQAGSSAVYREQRLILVPHNRVRRHIRDGKAYAFDVDGNGGGPEAGDLDDDQVREPDAAGNGNTQLTNEEKQVVLESLREKALFHIEDGDPAHARQFIDRIMVLDPGYEGLSEIRQKMRE